MTSDRRVDELFETLRRVRKILAEGRRTLAMSDAERWKALALARWEMLHALGRLSKYKESYLLDPIRMKGSKELTQRAARLVQTNYALLDQYRQFVEHWALTSPTNVDEAYRSQAWQMADRIEKQMAVDQQEIDTLLRDSAATPFTQSRHG